MVFNLRGKKYLLIRMFVSHDDYGVTNGMKKIYAYEIPKIMTDKKEYEIVLKAVKENWDKSSTNELDCTNKSILYEKYNTRYRFNATIPDHMKKNFVLLYTKGGARALGYVDPKDPNGKLQIVGVPDYSGWDYSLILYTEIIDESQYVDLLLE